MSRKTLLVTAICVSSVSLTGCSTTMSTAWSSVGDLFNGVSEVTKSAFLRGSSKKSDISFAENSVPDADGIYKTDIGEYVSDDVNFETSHSLVDNTSAPSNMDSGNLEFEIYDNYADEAVDTYVDTSPVPCPEDTYLNDKNDCMYLETETFDFADDVNMTEQFVDTSPHACPEGTYLNAENSCMYLETEEFDFAVDTPSLVPASDFTPDFALSAPALNGPIDCPEGFTLNGSNSCMFVGAGLQSGN